MSKSKLHYKAILCACGCGRKFRPKLNGMRKKYFSAECRPSSNVNRRKKVVVLTRTCICGCGVEFETDNERRVYFDREKCKIGPDQPKSVIIDKQFRNDICRRPGLLTRERGVLCSEYQACSDSEFVKGGLWKYEANGGVDCYNKAVE